MRAATSTFSEPFTPRGVAAFARAKFGRLFLTQSAFALLTAISIVWFFDENYFPVVRAAIRNLPDAGKISAGKLDWRGESPKLLAEGKFLALDIDLNHNGQIHSPADVQIEFGNDSIRVFSFLGYAEFFYPPDRFAPFNRVELEPLWGAWSAEILFFLAAAAAIGLLAVWWLLAAIYFVPIWIFGFFANRDLNLRASWKLSGAALLPGALLLTAGIFLYGFGLISLVSFGFVFAAHYVLGWIYLIVSLLFLPRISTMPPKGNPFVPRN